VRNNPHIQSTTKWHGRKTVKIPEFACYSAFRDRN
jgi:hypothetical protein